VFVFSPIKQKKQEEAQRQELQQRQHQRQPLKFKRPIIAPLLPVTPTGI
jgi:hypothetical protein